MNSPHLENGCIKKRVFRVYCYILTLHHNTTSMQRWGKNYILTAWIQRGEYNLTFTALNTEKWRKRRLDPYCGESHIFMVSTFHRKLLPVQVLKQDKTGNGTQDHSQLTLLGWSLGIASVSKPCHLLDGQCSNVAKELYCNLCHRAIVNSNLTFVWILNYEQSHWEFEMCQRA